MLSGITELCSLTYRKRKLTGVIKQRLEGMIKFCAQVNDWKVIELNIQPDHVHLVIQANAIDSPASIMQRIKGGTSKKVRELHPNSTESIWMKSFWAGGYYAETIGRHNEADTKAYIKNQEQVNNKQLQL